MTIICTPLKNESFESFHNQLAHNIEKFERFEFQGKITTEFGQIVASARRM
jgi:hypothetical protein